jgi:hypothetical protein
MFMDHCFVLAQGNVVNGNFIVSVLAPPPAETREQTVKAFPALDMCATQQNLVSLQRSKELLSQALTQHREDDRILILSDVRLDSPAVLKRLRKLFAGFEGIEPTVVVLMGSFASKEMIGRSRDLSAYTRLFDTLADIIAAHPVLAERTQVRHCPHSLCVTCVARPYQPRLIFGVFFHNRSLSWCLARTTRTSATCFPHRRYRRLTRRVSVAKSATFRPRLTRRACSTLARSSAFFDPTCSTGSAALRCLWNQRPMPPGSSVWSPRRSATRRT